MKAPLKIAANLVSIAALVALLLLPGSKYEWVETVDRSFSASDFEDTSGNRIVAVVVLLAVIVGAQLLLLARASEKRQRLLAAAFVLVTVIVCVTKF
ncbi:MAG TPA: hypothetical protein VJV78_16850 [Polyangiales bacterium]|nr:hypothetical protein [Polyangiales bacterium]